MEESVTLPLEAPNPVSLKQDLVTGTKHILTPALIGAGVGSGWQVYGIPAFDSVFAPNPPQFALLVILALTPLMYRILVHTSFERGIEYTFGFAVLALEEGCNLISDSFINHQEELLVEHIEDINH